MKLPAVNTRFIAVTAIAAIAVTAMACSSDDDKAPAPAASSGDQPAIGAPASSAVSTSPQVDRGGALPAGVPVVSNGMLGSAEAISSRVSQPIGVDYSTGYAYQYQAGNFSSGIVVNGIGTQDIATDTGIVYLGVESRAKTVSEARQAAAQAMTDVRAALKALGLADKDIVTTSFNIYPETVWIEIKDENGTRGQPQITGYVVNNSVEVTVRNLDLVGDVVDEAATKGGDLIRINSISFTVSDPSAYAVSLRELAAKDARAKAEVYAKAMGVTLGPLVFLTETSSSAPVLQKYDSARGLSAEAAYAPTPISGGSLDLTTTITAVFAIGQ